MSGPVAIVAVGSEIARSDLSGLFQFAAIVNINLAVVNALPLPALDGGLLALLFAEAVRGESYWQSTVMVVVVCSFCPLAIGYSGMAELGFLVSEALLVLCGCGRLGSWVVNLFARILEWCCALGGAFSVQLLLATCQTLFHLCR